MKGERKVYRTEVLPAFSVHGARTAESRTVTGQLTAVLRALPAMNRTALRFGILMGAPV